MRNYINLLNEVKTDKTMFDKNIGDSDILMGFEVESVPGAKFIKTLARDYVDNDEVMPEVQERIWDELGMWCEVVPDGSLSTHWGIEIVSEPYPLGEALDYLHETFTWMDNNEYTTDESTGLHINLSIIRVSYHKIVKNFWLNGERTDWKK